MKDDNRGTWKVRLIEKFEVQKLRESISVTHTIGRTRMVDHDTSMLKPDRLESSEKQQ